MLEGYLKRPTSKPPSSTSTEPVHSSGRKIGTLVVFVQRAKNLPNKRLIGKQDPYCELKLGDQTVRTHAIKRGNQHPEWEQEFRFPLYETAEEEVSKVWKKDDSNAAPHKASAKARKPSSRILHVACYAEDFRKPDFIGETIVDLTEALKTGEMKDFFTIKSKERYQGEVYLGITCLSLDGSPLYISESEDEDFAHSDSDEESPMGLARFSTSARSPSVGTNSRRSVSSWQKWRPDSPVGPFGPNETGALNSLEDINIFILPQKRDAAPQGVGTGPSKGAGYNPYYQQSLRYDVGHRGSPSPDDGSSPVVLGPQPLRIAPVRDVEQGLFGPRAPRRLPTPPIRSQSSQSSRGSMGRLSYGTQFSEYGTASSSKSIGGHVRAYSDASQTPLAARVPSPRGQYHHSSEFLPPQSQSLLATSGLPPQHLLTGSQHPQVLPSSSMSSQQLPSNIFVQSPEGSAISDAMTLTDDIGFAITWISPTPVKANGHFCDVFEGIHATDGRVALKRPRTGAKGYDDVVVRRFEREAATWRRLRHPHILEFLGTFKRDGHIYFVSPFISNGTLVEYIAEHPDINRIRLLCETADAVQYLHKEGIIHGDLKANNILIGDGGYSLLCDFGLTKTVESRTSSALRGAGTFRWQSPELWDNAHKSFESDVYAFGMTIVEVLTGHVPFHELNDVALMYAVMLRDERPSKTPVESSSGISYENVWDVASACWPRDPSKRISMTEALRRIRMDPSLTSSPEP